MALPVEQKRFKRKRGKCPYCGVVAFGRKHPKQKCKHYVGHSEIYKDGEKTGKYYWIFQRTIKPLTYTKVGRQLQTMADKIVQKKLKEKGHALSVSPVTIHEQQMKSEHDKLVAEFLAKSTTRGSRKSKHIIDLSTVSEYAKPAKKRELTLLRKKMASIKKAKKRGVIFDKMEVKVLKGKIRSLSHKIREAKKQAKQKARWAKYK